MIYVYFYRIEYSEKCSFYKRNFMNQLLKLVDISEKLERCWEIEKADIVFTIWDFVNNSELVGKKMVVYSLQDNSFSNQEIINNNNVLFVIDHCKICKICKICNATSVNSKIEFTSDHCKSEEYNKVFCLLNISELYKNKFQTEILPLSKRKYGCCFYGNYSI